MINTLFQALAQPPLMMAQLVLGFSWPAALVISAAIALFVGGLLALNYGTKAPRWFLLPLLLAHLQVFAYGQYGLIAWYVAFALFLASIAWVCRETLLAGLLFAYFLLVYGGAPAVLIYFS
jgi:hypothetical protein